MRFQDIPGHQAIKQRLTALVDTHHIPHALLLEGPGGSFKLSLARAMAQYIHCSNRTADGDSCGRCPACIQHQALSHIDTIFSFPVVKATSSPTPPISDDYLDQWNEFLKISPSADFRLWTDMFDKKNANPVMYVTESESLIHKLSLTGHTGGYRVVIVWLPERFRPETANKLLKLIEEPFEDTIFLLVSDHPDDILPTIYSRTQRIQVPRLDDETVSAYLATQHGVDPVEAKALAHITEGDVSEAVAHLKVNNLNTQLFDLFVQLMRLAYQRDVARLRTWANTLSSEGRDHERAFYVNAQRLVRENFIFNFKMPAINYMTRAESGFSTNFARFITEANVEQLVALFGRAASDIAANANDKFVNFDVALKVCFLLRLN